MPRTALFVVAVAAIVVVSGVPARAQDVSLGGGSDIRDGAVLQIAQGTSIPAIHHVFADNLEDEPVEVEFRAEAPRGIEIRPERESLRIDPQTSVEDRFAISVDDTVVPGDHTVTVQLVRSDIRARPGTITNIPAIGTTFTLRVVGEVGTAVVTAVSAESGQPVQGTLTLASLAEADPFQVASTQGSTLRTDVAPGDYEAAYTLAGRELARAPLRVEAGQTAETVLEVDTVAFALVAAEPVTEGGKVLLADLVAAVDNHLRALSGPVTIRAQVHHDGELVDTAVLDELDGLPRGVSEATLSYRPEDGFKPGTYRFVFELVTEQFTIQAGDEPVVDVPAPFPLLLALLVALAVLVVIALLVWAIRQGRAAKRARSRAAARTKRGRDGTSAPAGW